MNTPSSLPQRIGSFFAQPERLFLALAVPFGILFIFLSAPFQAPDEFNHFYRAFAISSGHFAGLTVSIPQSVYDFSTTVSNGLAGNDQNRQSKKTLVAELSRRYDAQPRVEVTIINSAIVSPLPYLPQALGVLVGRLARLSPILIFYLGRIANFLAWLGLTWLAIRVTPVHPRLFVALALMPMTLHQAASNSPDAATIAIGFLFIACILRMLMEPRAALGWRDWLQIALLTVAIALVKSIYIVAAGLLLAVVVRRFRQQRGTLPLALAVIALGLGCGLLWLQVTSQFVTVQMMNAARTPTTAGIFYILGHPQSAVPVLWNSAVHQTGEQMRQFIGVLGWLDTPLPGWVYPLYYLLLLFVVIAEPHAPFFFYLRERVWIALLAIATSVVLMMIFFYPDVSVGNGQIDMPQGRYFIPLGALYFLPFSQRRWCLPPDSPAWVGVALAHIVVLLAAARAMLWRYYAI